MSPNECTTYQYGPDPADSTRQVLASITYPEGNQTSYTYDLRGNVTQKQDVPKPGSGVPILTTSATYPTDCSQILAAACNKPLSITDTAGAETDFTYDPVHGGVRTMTQPALSNGIHPQTRYGYTAFNPPYALPGAGPIWKLTSTAVCQTQAAKQCPGGGDELLHQITYSADHLLPITTSVTNGDGSAGPAALTTTMTYDTAGNVSTVTDPLGSSTRYYYDDARQLTGVAGPDPDGGGPLRNRAIRTTYNLSGQVTQVEQGTTSDQSDGAMGGFNSLVQALTTYDAQGRVASKAVTGAGSQASLTQFSYWASGQLACTAVRLNPGAFSFEPDACRFGPAGSNGADQITKLNYDGAGRQAVSQTYVNPNSLRVDQWATYTPNGQVASLQDGNGNVTRYYYDGLDRLQTTQYPTPGNGQVGSSTDYEQQFYDVASNVTYRRRRDGSAYVSYYDALNHLTGRFDAAGQDNAFDRAYIWNNLGALTAAHSNTDWDSFYYDGYGRSWVASDGLGYTADTLDAAGRKVRVQTSSGIDVIYQYDAAGDQAAMLDHYGSTLATFAYDDLGRRTGVARSNGVSTSYGYDAVSRLSSLAHGYPNGALNQTVDLGYDAAGRITSRWGSNPTYDWTGSYAVTRSYANNGLNQTTQAGSWALSYNPSGLLQSDGTTAYGYDLADRLASAAPASGGASAQLAYDPLGRLSKVTSATGGVTQFRYDGDEVISDHDVNGNMLHQYLWDAAAGAPMLEYGGGGNFQLLADERGSITAVTDASGSNFAVDTYDEYGVPSGYTGQSVQNYGRFQYTGQIWLPEVGLYHYKARAYSPTFGKFMQPDPAGYGDGMNRYAYVHGDPLNATDPSGLSCTGSLITNSEGNCADGGYSTSLGGMAEASIDQSDREDATRRQIADQDQQIRFTPSGSGDPFLGSGFQLAAAFKWSVEAYRVVGLGEFESLIASNFIFLPSPSGGEEKYFWLDPLVGTLYAAQMQRQGGGFSDPPYHLVETTIPDWVYRRSYVGKVSDIPYLGQIKYVAVPNAYLTSLSPARLISFPRYTGPR